MSYLKDFVFEYFLYWDHSNNPWYYEQAHNIDTVGEPGHVTAKHGYYDSHQNTDNNYGNPCENNKYGHLKQVA